MQKHFDIPIKGVILCLTVMCVLEVNAQTCIPSTPISVDAAFIDEKTIRKMLENQFPEFNAADENKVRTEIGKCNVLTVAELEQIDSQKVKLGEQLQYIHRFGNIVQLRENKEKLKENRAASLNQMEKNLANTRQTGLYVVLLNNENINTTQADLIKRAQEVLAPRALRELGDNIIQRTTQVVNQQEVKDIVKSFTSGKCVIDFGDPKQNYSPRYFMFFGKVGVEPSRVTESMEGQEGDASNVTVINLETETDYQSALKRKGVSAAHIAYIDSLLIANQGIVASENEKAEIKRAKLIRDGEAKLADIDDEIRAAQVQYDERVKNLQKICDDLRITFQTPEEGCEKSKRYLRNQIIALDARWNDAKERIIEISPATVVKINEVPNKDIAQEAVKLSKKLEQTYGKDRKSEVYLEVENGSLTQYSEAKQVEISRKIQQIWIFPVPQGEGFKLTVFARFVITQVGKEEIVFENKIQDSDKDGLTDDVDQCPTQAGLRQFQGCPDSDGDNVPDDQDKCRKYKGTAELDGCPFMPNMAFVEGGTYYMGNLFDDDPSDKDKDNPMHIITVSDFWMSQKEISYDEYDAYCKDAKEKKPDDINDRRGGRPVAFVSWYDAIEYCNWRSLKERLQPVYQINKKVEDSSNGNPSGKSGDKYKWIVACDWKANGYRLPTEAEWEFAARQRGDKVRFGNGEDVADPTVLNLPTNVGTSTKYFRNGVNYAESRLTGSFQPNKLGLHEMAGNVAEWCWDWYDMVVYSNTKGKTDPKGYGEGTKRVVRGGSFSGNPHEGRAAKRSACEPYQRLNNIGFRVVRTRP